jgi:hypothetical protein
MSTIADLDLMSPVAPFMQEAQRVALDLDRNGRPTTAIVDPAKTRFPAAADLPILEQARSLTFDHLEEIMRGMPQPDCVHVHSWFPGIDGVNLYSRQITMPAGAVIASAIHMTEHTFVVSKGRCIIASPDGSRQEIAAPYQGRTMPGTRRMLLVLGETVWTTFHLTRQKTVEDVMKEIVIHPLYLKAVVGEINHQKEGT